MTDYVKDFSNELHRLIDIAEASHPYPIAASSVVHGLNRLKDLWERSLQSAPTKPEFETVKHEQVSKKLSVLAAMAERALNFDDVTNEEMYREVLGLMRTWQEYLSTPAGKVNEPEYDPAYVSLARVLADAFNQSAGGKGKDRHVKAEGQAFEDQPICQLQELYGRGYAFGQVGKKMEESMRLPYEQARAELLGGIVYLAAAVIDLEKEHERVQETRQQTMGSD